MSMHSGKWLMRRLLIKTKIDPFTPLNPIPQRCLQPNLVKMCPAISEKSFKENSYGRTDGRKDELPMLGHAIPSSLTKGYDPV